MSNPNGMTGYLNPTVLVALVGLSGVILGAVLNFIQNIVTNHYASKREKEQWERQSQDRIRELERIGDKEKREATAGALRKALSGLAGIRSLGYTYSDLEDQSKKSQIIALVQMVGEGVGELVLHEQSYKNRQILMDSLDHFMSSPTDGSFNLLSNIQIIYSEEESWHDSLQETGYRTFKIIYDEKFRHSEFINGVILPKTSDIKVEIKSLSNSTRESLVRAHPGILQANPDAPIALYLPTTKYGAVVYDSEIWHAQINVSTATPEKILEIWSRDFQSMIAN